MLECFRAFLYLYIGRFVRVLFMVRALEGCAVILFSCIPTLACARSRGALDVWVCVYVVVRTVNIPPYKYETGTLRAKFCTGVVLHRRRKLGSLKSIIVYTVINDQLRRINLFSSIPQIGGAKLRVKYSTLRFRALEIAK